MGVLRILTDRGTEDEAQQLARDLKNVGLPVVGVLGNHDFEAGHPDQVARILSDAGVLMLDGEAVEAQGIGFAGVKGFGGGFGRGALGPWGEPAIKALEQAARSPRQRFDAASMLGRLYMERKDPVHAVEWLERAAEAPAPTPDAGRALLYDLGQILASIGEQSRALAVFVELEAESGGYRDVAGQIERLSKAQARG